MSLVSLYAAGVEGVGSEEHALAADWAATETTDRVRFTRSNTSTAYCNQIVHVLCKNPLHVMHYSVIYVLVKMYVCTV